jgi:hypothetical protein
MKMKQTECSETSAYKIQTPGNYPEENIQHTEHGESLKSRDDVSGSNREISHHCMYSTVTRLLLPVNIAAGSSNRVSVL